MRGKKHSDTIRLAVMESVLDGNSISEAARQNNVDIRTACEWINSDEFARIRQIKQQHRLSSLENISLTCIEQHLKAITAYAEETAKPEFILKQNAADLAVLYQAIAERGFALLSALASSAGRNRDADEDSLPAIPS